MRFFYITKSMDAGDTAINPKNQAIYKKGEEILQLIKQIGDLIPEDNKHLHFINGQIFADAGIVSAEVAGFNQWNYIIYRWGLFNQPELTHTIKIRMTTSLLTQAILRNNYTAFLSRRRAKACRRLIISRISVSKRNKTIRFSSLPESRFTK